MRGLGLLTLFFATHVRGHPQCFYSDTSPDEDYVFSFCPDDMNTDGSCCNDVQEALSLERLNAYIGISLECSDLYKQVRGRLFWRRDVQLRLRRLLAGIGQDHQVHFQTGAGGVYISLQTLCSTMQISVFEQGRPPEDNHTPTPCVDLSR